MRLLAMVGGALVGVLMFGIASAQVSGLNITIPQGSVAPIQAIVNSQVCGTGTISSTGTVSMNIDQACIVPGATISFTSNGIAIGSTLTIPASGSGTLTLDSLLPASPVTITFPAQANASGTVNVLVNGVNCGSVALSASGTTNFQLPAGCTLPGGTITFTGAGGVQLAGSFSMPAGGTTLTLSSITSTQPVNVVLPPGSGTVSISVNGNACGQATLAAGSATTVTLSPTCATPGGTISFNSSVSGAVAGTLTVPTGGGTVVLSQISPAATLRLTLPSGPAGTLNVFANGTLCGTVNITGSAGTVDLPAACAVAGGTLTFTTQGTNLDLGASVNIPLTITTTPVVLPNLALDSPLTVTLPSGSGTVNVLVNGTLCATVALASGSTTTVSLAATCPITAGANVTFTTGNNIVLAGTGQVGASLSGNITLVNLQAATPVNITLPAGSGTVTAIVNGVICVSANLSTTGTVTLVLPANCIVPNATVTFTGTGGQFGTGTVALTPTLTVPATGSGTLVLSALAAPGVPGPADTGNAGLLATQGGTSWPLAILVLAALAAGATALRYSRR